MILQEGVVRSLTNICSRDAVRTGQINLDIVLQHVWGTQDTYFQALDATKHNGG